VHLSGLSESAQLRRAAERRASGISGACQRSSIGWPLAIATELDFAYRFKNYDPASKGRDDNEYRLVASAQMPVTRLVSTTLAYFGTFNDSNQRAFTYNRHIVSLSVGVRF